MGEGETLSDSRTRGSDKVLDGALAIGGAIPWRISGILHPGHRNATVLANDRDRTGMDGALSSADLERFLIQQGIVICNIHHASPEQEDRTKHSSPP